MVAVLHQVGGGRVIAIDRAVVLVGRSADCDVVITASQKISRRHCCLVQVDNSYYLRDLGSMNGIWLNGERVNREAEMSTGDKVMIGDAEFLFHPNARIEQKSKKATSAPPDANSEPLPTVEPEPTLNVTNDDVDAELVEDIDEFEIVDDVIPLGDDGVPLVETNEVEIIDEPIVDRDDPIVDLDDLDSSDDNIVLLDD